MKTKFTFLLIALVLFNLSLVSAVEWDNSGIYNEKTKTMTVRNLWGGGSEVATLKLNTPLNNYVPLGYQKVAEFTIDSSNNYNDALRTMNFYNKRDSDKSIQRAFDYKVLSIEQVLVNDYSDSCQSFSNGTISKCTSEVIGTHLEQREVWNNLNGKNLLKGEVTIGIFTEVYLNDRVEWIPTFFGIEISEWAIWTASLDVGLTSYWKFDEPSGTLRGNISNINFTAVGTSLFAQPGLILTSVGVDGAFEGFENVSGSDVTVIDFGTTQDYAFTFWINFTGDPTAFPIIFDSNNRTDPRWHLETGNTVNTLTWRTTTSGGGVTLSLNGAIPQDGLFHMVTGVRNNSGADYYFFVDTVLNQTALGQSVQDANANQVILGTVGSSSVANFNIDEFGIWNRTLTEADITQLFNNGSGVTFTPPGPPRIELNSPVQAFETSNNTVNFNCSATNSTSDFIENITFILDGVFNETITLPASTNSTTQIFTKILNFGEQDWSCQAVGEDLQIGSTAARDINITRIEIISQVFNSITTEGATETFSINFTKSPSLQISTVSLIYNDTVNSFPYLVSGNNVFSSSNIVIPIVTADTNLTFSWSINFTDGTNFMTAANIQTVLNIAVDDCSVFSNVIYNFTMFDEESQLILGNDTTLELQINLFDISKTAAIINFSQNFTNINPAAFCTQASILPTVNYSAFVVAKYSANQTDTNKSYAIEYHNILNQSVGNFTIPINISLFDLKQEDSTSFRLTFRDSSYVLAPDILVQVHRQYVQDNDFKIVEIPLTDSNGQTILNLVRNTIVYNFIMVNESGTIIGVFNSIKAFCQDFTIDDCTINLAPDALTESVFDYDEKFDIFISPASYNNVTDEISISFVTNDLTAQAVEMRVTRNNAFGNRTVCTDSLFAASGLLTCDVSSISDVDQFLFISVFVNGELARQETINLNATTLSFGTFNGAFYAFLLILFLITMFMEDKKVLVVSLAVGWVAVISLGLINGQLVGATSAGIWILVCIGIFLWKLNKEDSI